MIAGATTRPGAVSVYTTSGRGSTPEEIAERCVAKLIHVSESAPPEIRAQAREFRGAIEVVVVRYLREAIENDRVWVCAALRAAGSPELAEYVRSL